MKETRAIVLKNKIKQFEKKSFFISVMHRAYMYSTLKIFGTKKSVELKYRSRIGKKLDLDNPLTLNEKIQWLKMYYFQDYYIQACDKYLVREYLCEKLGKDMEPDLLFVTQDPSEVSLSKISYFPCIMKISNGSGQNLIINNNNQYTDKELIKITKKLLYEANTQARYGCEPQYLKKEPYIVFEKLLKTKNGSLPNDYKLFFLNGVLRFVYCSVDRLGINTRQLYDEEWNRLDALLLENATPEKYKKYRETKSIEKPGSYEVMKEIGRILSKDFPLARIDFFDVDDIAYVGEITLHHGSGHDRFYPEEMDLFYGNLLKLPEKNFELKI